MQGSVIHLQIIFGLNWESKELLRNAVAEDQAANGEASLWAGQYFDALKSQRQLNHLRWINQQLINSEANWTD